MVKKKEHLTRKVISGYVSLIVVATVAVLYIFNLVSKIAGSRNIDDSPMAKINLITSVLALLYEGETYTQFAVDPQAEFEKFNGIMDQVHVRMDSLRLIDSDNWGKIDTINLLVEKKRDNTKLLLETILEMKNVYAKSIAKEMSASRKHSKELEVRKQEENSKDTIVTQRGKKGFFKRLAEAFVPVKEDTTVRVNTTSRTETDSLVNAYDPSKEIASVLLNVQKEIALEREQLTQILTNRTNELHKDNHIITNEINHVLIAIEEKEIHKLQEEDMEKQLMIHSASRHLAAISILAIIIFLLFLSLTIRDIWRSRYYRDQLEKAKLYTENLLQSREKLMLAISHDIRAPLSSILGYIELLRKNKPDETQKDYLENMNVSAKHILSLVNDLLDFHRLESGKMDIHPAPFLIPSLFKEIYTGFKPLADAKSLRFNITIDNVSGAQAYKGDTVRIRQVVGNLLSNAIKFTQKGNVWMNVSVHQTDDGIPCLLVSVKDEGPGIAEDEQKKIFGEFTRLNEAEKTEGFGLGLSITGKLLSLMGGQITLQSLPGEGSEFTVTLPLQVSDEEICEEIPDKEETKLTVITDRKINCLVIDDDRAQIKLTEELLKRNQVNVIPITNPHLAVDLLDKASFDMILTDIQMPGLSGYELLSLVRSSGIPGSDTIPVVALSASAEEEVEHYIEAGFTGFLCKPFTSDELIALVNELLSVHLTPVNISSLTSFAGNDKEALNAIFQTFSEETEKSLILMKKALSGKDKEQISKIAHKLIPLLKMLEAHTLVDKLRLLEKKELSGQKWEQTVEEMIKQLSAIAGQIKLMVQ
ncbi:MAG: response regulator [Tannerellaceae bacterium]|jgi:signal transduction histidine kinase/DNA-binding response OmpR family regulator|nr:response regulator [Tannerellaceae bacterium]